MLAFNDFRAFQDYKGTALQRIQRLREKKLYKKKPKQQHEQEVSPSVKSCKMGKKNKVHVTTEEADVDEHSETSSTSSMDQNDKMDEFFPTSFAFAELHDFQRKHRKDIRFMRKFFRFVMCCSSPVVVMNSHGDVEMLNYKAQSIFGIRSVQNMKIPSDIFFGKQSSKALSHVFEEYLLHKDEELLQRLSVQIPARIQDQSAWMSFVHYSRHEGHVFIGTINFETTCNSPAVCFFQRSVAYSLPPSNWSPPFLPASYMTPQLHPHEDKEFEITEQLRKQSPHTSPHSSPFSSPSSSPLSSPLSSPQASPRAAYIAHIFPHHQTSFTPRTIICVNKKKDKPSRRRVLRVMEALLHALKNALFN